MFTVGREWLFDKNDPAALIVPARLMMVILLLATCLAIYYAARACFGPAAGLLALACAALSPTLLAHGRLVTTDLPITLATLLVLMAYARLLAHPRWHTLLIAALAFGSATVTKFSWPMIVPALVIMGVYVAWAKWLRVSEPDEASRAAWLRWKSVAWVAASWAALGVASWAVIWTTY